MDQKRDLSLLRPFDLEAAKSGEAICFQGCESSTSVTYIAGPDKGANIICDVGGYFKDYFHTALRMAPLCWVEGKPVYKGDVLYQTLPSLKGEKLVVTGINQKGHLTCLDADNRSASTSYNNLTWQKPKIKKTGWINVYPPGSLLFAERAYQHALWYARERVANVSHAYETEEIANANSAPSRLACIRIEWEEPAK